MVSNNQKQVNDIEPLFNELSSALLADLTERENLTISLAGENSQFCRINAGKIRQIGLVDEFAISLDLIHEQRRAEGSISLTGDLAGDLQEARMELARLREEVAQLPEDPYLVFPPADKKSRTDQRANLLDSTDGAEKLLPVMEEVDLSGIWASGRIVRGNINSAGSKHWFSTDSFSLDYSLLNAQEKMVKGTFAGSNWQQQSYEDFLSASIEKLKMMDRPSVKIKPGNYRTYIAPAGVSDLLAMFSWHGLSEAALQTGESAFARMRNDGVKLSSLFSLAEDFSSGRVPLFNETGEVAPERVDLIKAGELKNSLVSSRSAKEFSVQSNYADEDESMRSPVMAAGNLQQADILAALGTGVYLSNLHYLNWSDVAGGRVTGMTRYACFWVEDGEIKGPLDTMRFDDSLYHFFGDHLEAVTAESQIIPDVGTYEGRGLGVTQCPGVLLSSFELTL